MEFQWFLCCFLNFRSKRAILAILAPKVRKWAFLRTFAPQNALFRTFRSKTVKTGTGQKCCSSQCFFRYFECHFRKKAEKGGFWAFWAVFPLLDAKNSFCVQKAKNRKSGRKTKNHVFRPKRQTMKNISIWARFWSPKLPKAHFSLLGQLFRSGAFLAPKARQKWKISTFWLFCSQKWKIAFLRFWSKKRCPERYVYKGFCASDRKV